MSARIPCRCEQCHRISYETEEPKNPDLWFCGACKRGDPGGRVPEVWDRRDEEFGE